MPDCSIKPAELIDYDALGLAELIRSGQLSASELMSVTLQRIGMLDGQLNGVATLAQDRAIERAKDSRPEALFAGVPTFLKDVVDLAGEASTNGSRLLANNLPQQSSAYVKSMEANGLTIIGMTNSPEFASMVTTDNQLFGETRNPWDLRLSSGGSSGGSAAVVAAGYAPLAHGTDGGGSNRIPASYCGVLGMKPSRYHLLCGEVDGIDQFLRTHQTISRSVRDSAALFAATRNPFSPYTDLHEVTGPSKRRLRIGVSSISMLGNQPSVEIETALEDAVKLCTQLGHEVVPIDNPFDGRGFFDAYSKVMLKKLPDIVLKVEEMTGVAAEKSGLLTPLTISMARQAMAYDAEAHIQGEAYFRHLNIGINQLFNQVDVWLTPVTPNMAPERGEIACTKNFTEVYLSTCETMAYTAIANATGSPAMSVPLYWEPIIDMPIGTHFMAAPGTDNMLYELAYELELARPWGHRWAPVSAKFVDLNSGYIST